MDNLYESLGSKSSIYPSKEETLMACWRFTSLSIHGIEGAFHNPAQRQSSQSKLLENFQLEQFQIWRSKLLTS